MSVTQADVGRCLGMQTLLLFWGLYYNDKNVNIHLYYCRHSSYDWNLQLSRFNRTVLRLTSHWSQGLVQCVFTCLLCLRHPPTVCRHMGWVKVPVGVNVVLWALFLGGAAHKYKTLWGPGAFCPTRSSDSTWTGCYKDGKDVRWTSTSLIWVCTSRKCL